MSILNLSDVLFTQSLGGSSSAVHLGSFTNDSTARQLGIVRVMMYFDGTFNGERIKLSVTDSISSPTFTWDSDTILVTDLDSTMATGANWLGWVKFDFGKQWVAASTAYHLTMTATGYTEADGHEITMVFDYPAPWNGSRQGLAQEHPIAFQVFGYERV